MFFFFCISQTKEQYSQKGYKISILCFFDALLNTCNIQQLILISTNPSVQMCTLQLLLYGTGRCLNFLITIIMLAVYSTSSYGANL